MIQYQILQTDITRTVWERVRRITIEILGVKGLIVHNLPYQTHTFTLVRAGIIKNMNMEINKFGTF